MMIGFDVKKHIQRNVQKTMEEFAAREDIVTKFGTPLIGYVDEMCIRDRYNWLSS